MAPNTRSLKCDKLVKLYADLPRKDIRLLTHRAYPFCPGIHSERGKEMAGKSRSNDPVHRAWKPVGEWLCGVVHREISR